MIIPARRSLFEERAPEALLALAILISAVALAITQWGVTFFQDTWAFLLDPQEFSAHAFFMPHNEHIVVLPVAITKLLLAIFGMTSNTPEQVAMALTLFVVAILVFGYVRRRTEAWLALIAAVLVLFLGSASSDLLWPFESEFTLPMAFGLAALLLLDRDDRRGDAWACVTLALAVISGSLGLCFVAAAFVDLILKQRERGWRRAYVFAIPLLIYLAWYAGWGHEAEHHVTLHNILVSPRYVAEGFASVLDSLAGLSTIPIDAPGQNDWGRPLLVGAIALFAFGQWRRPGLPRTLWPVTAAALGYWLLAAFSYIPGREADSTRYVYAGAIFLLLMVAELLRSWPFGRKALIAAGAAAFLVIGPNLAQMRKEATGRGTKRPYPRRHWGDGNRPPHDCADFFLGSPETAGTASLALVEAHKYFEAVDRWGSPAYTPAELETAPQNGRHYADIVLSQALPITSSTVSGAFSPTPPAGKACATLPGGGASAKKEIPLKPGEVRVEVAPGPPATIALRRFATEEFPVPITGGKGGATTIVRIPRDRASQPWYMHVEASQLTRVCLSSRGVCAGEGSRSHGTSSPNPGGEV